MAVSVHVVFVTDAGPLQARIFVSLLVSPYVALALNVHKLVGLLEVRATILVVLLLLSFAKVVHRYRIRVTLSKCLTRIAEVVTLIQTVRVDPRLAMVHLHIEVLQVVLALAGQIVLGHWSCPLIFIIHSYLKHL